MNDLKDIVGNEANGDIDIQHSINKNKIKINKPPKRPKGLNKEVYDLMVAQKKFKELNKLVEEAKNKKSLKKGAGNFKIEKSEGEAVKWIWREFYNSARRDNYRLAHWEPRNKFGIKGQNEEKNPDVNNLLLHDYEFAKFNKTLELDKYSLAEYTEFFQSNTWTKPETDLLWGLCSRFDLRFTVIHDRWKMFAKEEEHLKASDRIITPSSKSNPSKSIEDLKDRYYFIAKKLLALHNNSTHELTYKSLKSISYNIKAEQERKKQLELSFIKTRKSVKDEDQAFLAGLGFSGELGNQNNREMVGRLRKLTDMDGIDTGSRKRVKKLISMMPITKADEDIDAPIGSDGSILKMNARFQNNPTNEIFELSSPSLSHYFVSTLNHLQNDVSLPTITASPRSGIDEQVSRTIDKKMESFGLFSLPVPLVSISEPLEALKTGILKLMNEEEKLAAEKAEIEALNSKLSHIKQVLSSRRKGG